MVAVNMTADPRKHECYAKGYWRNEDLWTTFLHRAHEHESRRALIHDDRSISFGELLRDAERLGRGLAARGVQAGDVVIVHGRNSIETVTALLGCAWRGSIMAGVPPMFSELQLQAVARSAAARAVICLGDPKEIDRAMAGARISETVGLIVAPDEFADRADITPWSDLFSAGATVDRAPVDPDALALLAYSSGTTGAPKGVMHSSNTVRYAIEQRAALHGVGHADVCIVVSQFGFVGNIAFGLLTGPVIGATTVLMRSWDANVALERMAAHRVSYGLFMPTHVHDLLASPRLEETDLGCFQRAAMGGLSRDRRLEVMRRLGARPLPGYGMSECLGNATCTPGDAEDKILGCEGRPYPGTVIRIVDEDDRDLPVGEIGRVLITGPSRCFGYYNAPELTRAALTGDGYFRTGDIGRLDADGYFTFAGREKEIIRRGGVTIVPGEVEAALQNHPRIARAAIVAMPDPRLGERACACLITTDGKPLDLEELSGFLQSRGIARYLWPERVELFDEFPLTPSLKVKKPALVAMLTGKSEGTPS